MRCHHGILFSDVAMVLLAQHLPSEISRGSRSPPRVDGFSLFVVCCFPFFIDPSTPVTVIGVENHAVFYTLINLCYLFWLTPEIL